MRINHPINDVETVLPAGQFIYSRTDINGTITEANEAFAQISGYQREEMLGQPHNMVRHPDMPPEAFADMWRDLKAGRPWRGLVKNRRKDGGYYWVVANASPVREEGRIVGYQSVRTCPSRDEIDSASEAYRRIGSGDQSIHICHGRVVPRRLSPWAKFNSLEVQLPVIGLVGLLGSALASAMAWTDWNISRSIAGVVALSLLTLNVYFLTVFTPRLNTNLRQIREYLEQLLITGNLQKRFSASRYDLIGAVADDLDRFISSVQATVQGMADTARHVQRIANDVSQGMHSIQEAAHIQGEATSSAAAGVEEITVSIGEVASHAISTRDAATSASEASETGTALSEQACTTILSLSETVKSSAAQVERLGKQSVEISRITDTIKDIADQTNLLALNAAIEAARAGELGRGFAVVADEVRKLAERTTKATHEISEMIRSVQSETDAAVGGMRSGAAQVENGVKLVQDARGVLQEISAQMNATLSMVRDISHSSKEQENAMTIMAQSVERVAEMTDRNMAAVDKTTQRVDRLNEMVDRMNKSVSQYAI